MDCKRAPLSAGLVADSEGRTARLIWHADHARAFTVEAMPTHVLIVDANRSAAHVTRAIVARALPGATLTVAHTLEDAWRELRDQRPDVLLLDPPPDQLAVARLIQYAKEGCPQLRLILLAWAPTPSLRRTMEALGVELYLEKPALLSQLAHALQTAATSSPV